MTRKTPKTNRQDDDQDRETNRQDDDQDRDTNRQNNDKVIDTNSQDDADDLKLFLTLQWYF